MANNEAKYKGVLTGLNLAKAVGSSVVIHNDSQVAIGHINENYKTKGERVKYLSLVKRWTDQNIVAEFVQVPREEKEHVDRLAKATSTEHMTIGHH